MDLIYCFDKLCAVRLLCKLRLSGTNEAKERITTFLEKLFLNAALLKMYAKARPLISKHILWDVVNYVCTILAALLAFLAV